MTIHTPDDGRLCRRQVFVDGTHVPLSFYGDVEAGFVRYYLQPLRANRRQDAARWAKKRGRVEIFALIEPLPWLESAPSYFDWAASRRLLSPASCSSQRSLA